MFQRLSFSSILFLTVLFSLNGVAKDLAALDKCSTKPPAQYGAPQDYTFALYHGKYLFKNVRPTYLSEANPTTEEKYLKAIELNDPSFLPQELQSDFRLVRSDLPRPMPYSTLGCNPADGICYLAGNVISPLSVALVHGKAKVVKALMGKLDSKDDLMGPHGRATEQSLLAILSRDAETKALYQDQIDESMDYRKIASFIVRDENWPSFYASPSTSRISLFEKAYASFPAEVQKQVLSELSGRFGGSWYGRTESPYLIEFVANKGGYDLFFNKNLSSQEIGSINETFGKTLAYKPVMNLLISRGYNKANFRYLDYFDAHALATYCASDFPNLVKNLKAQQLINDKVIASTYKIATGGGLPNQKLSVISYFNVQTLLREMPSLMGPYIPVYLLGEKNGPSETEILRFYASNGWKPYTVVGLGHQNKISANYLHILLGGMNSFYITAEFIDDLIAAGTDFSRQGTDYSGLNELVQIANVDVAQRLPAMAKLGLELNIKQIQGVDVAPPYLYLFDRLQTARALAEAGASVNDVLLRRYPESVFYPDSYYKEVFPYNDGITVLMWAAARYSDVGVLLVPAANTSLKDARGWTALHYAAEAKNMLNVQKLVAVDPSLAEQVSSTQESFLHLLLQNTNPNRNFKDCEIESLIVAGKSTLNAARTSDGKTALHLAAMAKLPKCLGKMVDLGGNVTALDKSGNTPLDYLNK